MRQSAKRSSPNAEHLVRTVGLVSGGGMVQYKHMDPVGCGQVLSVRRCVLEGLVKIMRSCH